MSAASSSDKGESRTGDLCNPDKRRRVISELSATRGVNKTGLASCLRVLNARGYLNDPLVATPTHGQYRRAIQSAVESDGLQTWTQYGYIIQEMNLDSPLVAKMFYINPFSLVYHLCDQFPLFFALLCETLERCSYRLRIIVYVDGVDPGNPLHPETQRHLEVVYWTFIDFPSWFLQRTDAWFVFGIVRTKTVESLEGGMSEFCDRILHIHFPKTGLSWSNGVSMQCASKSVMVSASFHGFLADEVALKTILNITGQAGSFPCFNHLNTANRWVPCGHDRFKHWDPNRGGLIKLTREHLDEQIVRLRECRVAELKTRQTKLALNFNPRGLLFNDDTRTRILTIDTLYIRDHMHTLTSNGVAGTHLALVVQALDTLVGVQCGVVRTYALRFCLPKARGKVSTLFFKDGLMGSASVKHFAYDVLGMVPILYTFSVEKVQPRGWLPKHIECFIALHTILCIIRRQTMNAIVHTRLTSVIDTHARLFLELYGDKHAKIKFHHLYDLPDDLLAMGKAVGCYVTERKNKEAIDVADGIQRHIERTATCTFLQRSLRRWHDRPEICMPVYLQRARFADNKKDLLISDEALLPCGTVYSNDLVLTQSNHVAKVLHFWQKDGHNELYAELLLYVPVAGMPLRWSKAEHIDFADASSVVEAVSYYEPSPNIVVVAMPVT